MIGFFIKKAFFDGWDNLIALIIMNLGYVVLLGFGYLVTYALEVSAVSALVVMIIWVCILQFYNGIVSFFTYEFVKYKRPGISEFFGYARRVLPYLPVICIYTAVIAVILLLVLPFYMATPGILGAVSVAVMFWVLVFAVLALQYYYPVVVQLGDPPLKALKKSMIITLDNLGFSVFLFIYTCINTVISVLTAFLVPGIASVLMSHQVALRLRLMKYDYLEEHPEAKKRDIPWYALLVDERKKVGPRSLKGMIFPWKE